jgi:hypothetical protein
MSRQELQQLTERLALRQAAQTERRRRRRPGVANGFPEPEEASSGRRSPTPSASWPPCCPCVGSAPGGSWPSCLASARTIGNAPLDVGPLLEQDGYAPAPAKRRFSTSAALVDFANSQHDASATNHQLDSFQLHCARNVLAKVSQAAVDEAPARAQGFATRYQHLYPFRGGLSELYPERAHHPSAVPAQHRQRIRQTTCLSAPSARPADGPRSSADSLASGPASRWSGRGLDAPAKAGAA